jgi:hypothetical protein
MSHELTSAQLRRREEIVTELNALQTAWDTCKQHLDALTTVVALPGVNVSRVFFTLGTQGSDSGNPLVALRKWSEHRLVQLEALEALTKEQKAHLGVSPATVTETLES